MGGDGVSQVLSLKLTDLPLDDELDVRDLPPRRAAYRPLTLGTRATGGLPDVGCRVGSAAIPFGVREARAFRKEHLGSV